MIAMRSSASWQGQIAHPIALNVPFLAVDDQSNTVTFENELNKFDTKSCESVPACNNNLQDQAFDASLDQM